jgi:hypothetical protein
VPVAGALVLRLTLLASQFTVPRLVKTPDKVTLDSIFNAALDCTVTENPDPLLPPFQCTWPLMLSDPKPFRTPLFMPRTPFVFTALAWLKLRVWLLFVRVCRPLTPPRVKLEMVGLTFRITV